MKKNFSLATAAILFGTLFLASCAKDEDPAPIDGGSSFIGSWRVSETSTDYPSPSTYNCVISDSSNASYILFAYLYGFNKKTYATVSGNSFTIPKQIIQGNNVSGNGGLTNANRMDLKYLIQTTGTHYDTVTAVLTK
ncbi:MAG: hypothetical protein H0W84_04060 [Bacteroidetes bacterium]|nr:hypothetical protein [Bacteroidota bacterium]